MAQPQRAADEQREQRRGNAEAHDPPIVDRNHAAGRHGDADGDEDDRNPIVAARRFFLPVELRQQGGRAGGVDFSSLRIALYFIAVANSRSRWMKPSASAATTATMAIISVVGMGRKLPVVTEP